MAELKKAKSKRGRNELPEMSENQRYARTEILNPLRLYFRPALKELALIAGLKLKDKRVEGLEMEDDEESSAKGKEKEVVAASVRTAACKVLVDAYRAEFKEVYPKDSKAAVKLQEEEDNMQRTATVSKLSLHVIKKDE